MNAIELINDPLDEDQDLIDTIQQEDGKWNKAFYLLVFVLVSASAAFFCVLGVSQYVGFEVYVTNNSFVSEVGNVSCFRDVRYCVVNKDTKHFFFRCVRLISNTLIVIGFLVMLVCQYCITILNNSGISFFFFLYYCFVLV